MQKAQKLPAVHVDSAAESSCQDDEVNVRLLSEREAP